MRLFVAPFASAALLIAAAASAHTPALVLSICVAQTVAFGGTHDILNLPVAR